MSTVNYSLRIDAIDKQKAEEVFKALGMTFSTGINIYIKAVGRQKRIPFELALAGANPFFSEENQNRLALSEKQIAEGNIIYKTEQDLELNDE